MRYEEEKVDLPPGAVLALVTDGVTEAHVGEEMLEISGVAEVLQEHAAQPAETIAEAILSRARQFSGGYLRDDVAILGPKSGGAMSMKTPARARVLICEDEGLTALRLKKALTSLGYEVAGEAKNGEEAVSLAAQLNPDAILMDIRMPKLDGIAATEQIMSARPTAIVMITAYSERELVDAAVRAGASGYLVKPVSDEQIEPALAVALNRFAELRELNDEVTDLKEALEVRKVVERAKGILMRRLQIPEDEAYKRLQKLSRDRRQSLKQTSEQVLAAADLLG